MNTYLIELVNAPELGSVRYGLKIHTDFEPTTKQLWEETLSEYYARGIQQFEVISKDDVPSFQLECGKFMCKLPGIDVKASPVVLREFIEQAQAYLEGQAEHPNSLLTIYDPHARSAQQACRHVPNPFDVERETRKPYLTPDLMANLPKVTITGTNPITLEGVTPEWQEEVRTAIKEWKADPAHIAVVPLSMGYKAPEPTEEECLDAVLMEAAQRATRRFGDADGSFTEDNLQTVWNEVVENDAVLVGTNAAVLMHGITWIEKLPGNTRFKLKQPYGPKYEMGIDWAEGCEPATFAHSEGPREHLNAAGEVVMTETPVEVQYEHPMMNRRDFHPEDMRSMAGGGTTDWLHIAGDRAGIRKLELYAGTAEPKVPTDLSQPYGSPANPYVALTPGTPEPEWERNAGLSWIPEVVGQPGVYANDCEEPAFLQAKQLTTRMVSLSVQFKTAEECITWCQAHEGFLPSEHDFEVVIEE